MSARLELLKDSFNLKMLNNILFYWLQTILVFILINILIRIYFYFKFNFFISVTFETFFDINGKTLIKYFMFKNIFRRSSNWKTKECYIKILYNLLNNLKIDKVNLHNKVCLSIFEIDHKNKSFNAISEPCIINNINNISANELYYLINWNDYAFYKNKNNIFIIILNSIVLTSLKFLN